MTNRENYKRAFQALRPSATFTMEGIEMKRSMKFSTPRAVVVAVMIAILTLGTMTVAFAADLGGIRKTVTLWIQGQPRDAVVIVEPNDIDTEVVIEDDEAEGGAEAAEYTVADDAVGSYTVTWQDEDGETHVFSDSFVAMDEDGAVRPVTMDEVPQSWLDGMELIRRLYTLGAFPENTLNTSEALTSQMFRDKQAAMQFDGSWFMNSLPPENMDSIEVMPVPSAAGDGVGIIGGVSMGFYLTRRVWDDPTRRDAAVDLLSWLTQPEHLNRLADWQISGALAASVEDVVALSADMLRPIQDDMDRSARERWLLTCVPTVAAGDMTAEECWEQVMALDPFGTGR